MFQCPFRTNSNTVRTYIFKLNLRERLLRTCVRTYTMHHQSFSSRSIHKSLVNVWPFRIRMYVRTQFIQNHLKSHRAPFQQHTICTELDCCPPNNNASAHYVRISTHVCMHLLCHHGYCCHSDSHSTTTSPHGPRSKKCKVLTKYGCRCAVNGSFIVTSVTPSVCKTMAVFTIVHQACKNILSTTHRISHICDLDTQALH